MMIHSGKMNQPQAVAPPPRISADQELAAYATTTSPSAKRDRFKQDLDAQVRMKRERQARERAERTQYEERQRHEYETYNPFGHPGCGAPLRDATGHVMASVRGVTNSPERAAYVERELASPHGAAAAPPAAIRTAVRRAPAQSEYAPPPHTGGWQNQPTPSYAGGQYATGDSAAAYARQRQQPRGHWGGMDAHYNVGGPAGNVKPTRTVAPPPKVTVGGGARWQAGSVSAAQAAPSPPRAQATNGGGGAPEDAACDGSDQRFVRYQFNRLTPEVQQQITTRQRKIMEVQQSLREQIAEKQRRKAVEVERERAIERAEEERLQRERAELAAAYERDHSRPKGPAAISPRSGVAGGGGGGAATASPAPAPVVRRAKPTVEHPPPRAPDIPMAPLGTARSARSTQGGGEAGRISAMVAEREALRKQLLRQEESMRRLQRDLESVRSERDSLAAAQQEILNRGGRGGVDAAPTSAADMQPSLASRSKFVYDSNAAIGALSPPARRHPANLADPVDPFALGGAGSADAVSPTLGGGGLSKPTWQGGEATDQLDELLLDFVHRRRNWAG